MNRMTKLICGAALAMMAGCLDSGRVDSGKLGTTDELLTSTGSGSSTGSTTPVFHSVWNGGSANAWNWGWYSSGYIDAFENTSGLNRAAYLYFAVSSVDPNSLQCYTWTDWWGYTYSWCYYTRYTWSYGWGQIPAQDFQVNPNAARVKYTVGSDSSFYAYQCTIDYSTWTFNCGVPTGGDIDVAWSKDGQWSSSHSGTDQSSYGPYTFQTSGTWSSNSAHASGSILGASFDASGGFGDTHQSNVTKDILNTPQP